MDSGLPGCEKTQKFGGSFKKTHHFELVFDALMLKIMKKCLVFCHFLPTFSKSPEFSHSLLRWNDDWVLFRFADQ
jgi:hypothetical protein